MYEFAADVGMIDQNGELPEVRMHGEARGGVPSFFHLPPPAFFFSAGNGGGCERFY